MTDAQPAGAGRTSSFWQRRASYLEVIAVAAVALAATRFFMGWDWSTVSPDGNGPGPFSDSSVDTRHGLGVGIVAALGILWLALRGRAVIGPVAVFAPIVVFSGWRMNDARVIGASFWPIGLTILTVLGGIGAFLVSGAGALIRRHIRNRPQQSYLVS